MLWKEFQWTALRHVNVMGFSFHTKIIILQSHCEETLQVLVASVDWFKQIQSTQQYVIEILWANITIKETSCDDSWYHTL